MNGKLFYFEVSGNLAIPRDSIEESIENDSTATLENTLHKVFGSNFDIAGIDQISFQATQIVIRGCFICWREINTTMINHLTRIRSFRTRSLTEFDSVRGFKFCTTQVCTLYNEKFSKYLIGEECNND